MSDEMAGFGIPGDLGTLGDFLGSGNGTPGGDDLPSWKAVLVAAIIFAVFCWYAWGEISKAEELEDGLYPVWTAPA